MLPNALPTSHRTWLTDLAVLAGFLLLFYLLWLGSYPLFTPDEGRYSEVAREMITSRDYITPRVDGVAFLDKPILYYWLQAIALYLFGIREWAVRLFPALLGIGGCLATYVAGRLLFNRRTGWLSAIILATTPLYFGGAHYADLNLEVAVFISATLLFFITAVSRQDHLRSYFLFASYFCAALAFLTKGLIGIAFPGIIIGAWILLLNRWALLKKIYLISGLVIFVMITLPWYLLIQKANPEFLHYFFVTQQVSRFLSAGHFNNATPVWFYLPIVLLGFFPWTIFLISLFPQTMRTIWQHRSAHTTELFLLLWIAVIFVFFSIPSAKTVGYIIPIFPALALLVGQYLSQQWETITPKRLYLNIVYFMIFASVFAALLLALPFLRSNIPADFVPHLWIIALIFLLSALLSVFCFYSKKLLTLFVLCTFCSALFLLTVTQGATYLNQNSTKPLVASLKTIIQPQDEVITYFRYYQDVPMYLGKQVSIVANWNSPDIAYKDNWVRELWYGMPFQNTADWLISDATFWQRWNGDKRVFVFVGTNYLDQFEKTAQTYFFLDEYNNIFLFSNKLTVTK